MKDIVFTWDTEKDRVNQEKHEGISFKEAKTVFFDEFARVVFDPNHSAEEDRFIILGLSNRPRLLVVCHCYRESDSIIRIISARKANTKEEKTYERFRNA